MIIELLLDKEIKKSKFKSTDARFIRSITKIDGTDNYILTITHRNESMQDIKDMLEIEKNIIKKLNDEKITFTTLINEPSSFLVKKLYSLAQDFENKLRKFICIALCDTNDLIQSAFTSMKSEISKKIPTTPEFSNANLTIEYSDLSNIFKFLFADKNLCKVLNEKKIIRDDNWLIHKQLNERQNTTLWNSCFKDKYKYFHFDEYYETIYNYRNDVMHFHNISYDTYIKARKLFNRAIKELNETLKSNIVLEVEDIFSNPFGLSAITDTLGLALSTFALNSTKLLRNALIHNIADSSSKFYDSLRTTLNAITTNDLYNKLNDTINISYVSNEKSNFYDIYNNINKNKDETTEKNNDDK